MSCKITGQQWWSNNTNTVSIIIQIPVTCDNSNRYMDYQIMIDNSSLITRKVTSMWIITVSVLIHIPVTCDKSDRYADYYRLLITMKLTGMWIITVSVVVHIPVITPVTDRSRQVYIQLTVNPRYTMLDGEEGHGIQRPGISRDYCSISMKK